MHSISSFINGRIRRNHTPFCPILGANSRMRYSSKIWQDIVTPRFDRAKAIFRWTFVKARELFFDNERAGVRSKQPLSRLERMGRTGCGPTHAALIKVAVQSYQRQSIRCTIGTKVQRYATLSLPTCHPMTPMKYGGRSSTVVVGSQEVGLYVLLRDQILAVCS